MISEHSSFISTHSINSNLTYYANKIPPRNGEKYWLELVQQQIYKRPKPALVITGWYEGINIY